MTCSSENITIPCKLYQFDNKNFMHKTLYFFPILVKTTLFFPILKAPAPFPKRVVRALNLLPTISSQENSFQKKFVPHFAPLIFIQKNLLPKFFLPRICCQTFLLPIFLLTMKFHLQKFLQNIFAGEISSSQESLLQNLIPKISSQENLL